MPMRGTDSPAMRKKKFDLGDAVGVIQSQHERKGTAESGVQRHRVVQYERVDMCRVDGVTWTKSSQSWDRCLVTYGRVRVTYLSVLKTHQQGVINTVSYGTRTLNVNSIVGDTLKRNFSWRRKNESTKTSGAEFSISRFNMLTHYRVRMPGME